MNIFKYSITLMALLLFFCAGSSFALITKETLLTPEQQELLLPSAQEQYVKAASFIDRANYTVGLRYLKKAFDEQQDSASLNFLVAYLAVDRARQSFGKESVDYYDLAEEALKANMKIRRLSFVNRQRTEKKLELVKDERANVPERDNKRREIGRVFIQEQLILRGKDDSEKSDESSEEPTGIMEPSIGAPGSTAPFTPPAGAPFTAPGASPSGYSPPPSVGSAPVGAPPGSSEFVER